MKINLDNAIVKNRKDIYLTLIIIIAPLLNLLPGLNLDMYAPSMPAISKYFSVSSMLVKNTMSATMLGMMVGCMLFGALVDSVGRKRSLLIGISIYILASFAAIFSQNIYQLLTIRFFQGLMVASISIGCRAIIIDNFSGHRYSIAILYSSIAYGSAPIIGPFFGALLQHYIGWKANFYAFSLIGVVLLLSLITFVEESLPKRQSLNFSNLITQYTSILKHKLFLAGAVIGIIAQIELLLYPTLGPFIVENIMHHSALIYGYTALTVGAGYLIGTLINRILLKVKSPKIICELGAFVAIIGILIAILFAIFWPLNLLTLIMPIFLLCASVGFIYPNIMGLNLKQFPDNAGVAMSILIGLIALGSAFGIYILSQFHINSLISLSATYIVLISIQLAMFFFVYQKLFEKEKFA